MGEGAPHIHFLYSQFSLFLARSLDNTSIVRDEYTQSCNSDHCLAPHQPNLSVFQCPSVPVSHSHSHIPHCSALSRSLSLLKENHTLFKYCTVVFRHQGLSSLPAIPAFATFIPTLMTNDD